MAASWSWPTAAASGACASTGILGTSRRSASSASTRSSSCPRRRGSRRCWPRAAPRSRRCSSIRRSPPASGTGLPTRCSTRRASPPAAARARCPRGKPIGFGSRSSASSGPRSRSLRQRPLSQALAVPPSLGQKRGRGHRAGRAHSPRHDRRPHDRLGPHRPALTVPQRLPCRVDRPALAGSRFAARRHIEPPDAASRHEGERSRRSRSPTFSLAVTDLVG